MCLIKNLKLTYNFFGERIHKKLKRNFNKLLRNYKNKMKRIKRMVQP